jgi:hypothetical protein
MLVTFVILPPPPRETKTTTPPLCNTFRLLTVHYGVQRWMHHVTTEVAPAKNSPTYRHAFNTTNLEARKSNLRTSSWEARIRPPFMELRNLPTVFTKAEYWIKSWARWIQSKYILTTYIFLAYCPCSEKNKMRLMRSPCCLSVYPSTSVHLSVYPSVSVHLSVYSP